MSDAPHRCPVCTGTGQVDAGFYHSFGGVTTYTTGGVNVVQCRSCDGLGIVWPPASVAPDPWDTLPGWTDYPRQIPPNVTTYWPPNTWTYQHGCAWPAGTFEGFQ